MVTYGASRLLTLRVWAALDALASSPFFPRVSDRMLILALKQVRWYMAEPLVREAARARRASAISTDSQVIVAHSLGSMVAHEALCANPGWPVTHLVSLGSPLGLRSIVFDRLDPQPANGVPLVAGWDRAVGEHSRPR